MIHPFTIEDLNKLKEKELQDGKLFCDTCVYENSCATLLSQNKMCEFTGIPHCNGEWGCTLHTTEEQYQAKLEAEESEDENNEGLIG